jgi:NADH-quinone oxidoreductase subunit M
VALFFSSELAAFRTGELMLIGLAAVLLPLFPLHGLYTAALTRLPRFLSVIFAVILPAAGLYLLARVMPQIPATLLRAANILALFGSLYGSLKALAQTKVPELLAYTACAFFSVVWWHASATGAVTGDSIAYTAAVAVLIAALQLAWQSLAGRCGDLTLRQMNGLARPMPRFAVVMSLLIMAGIGLPPFGLFRNYMAMLLQPGISHSAGLIVIVLCWFLASWCLFRMMQRLLFGAERTDVRYQDLRPGESAQFVALLLILALLGAIRPAWLGLEAFTKPQPRSMEIMTWRK